jgi:beta-galactosidase
MLPRFFLRIGTVLLAVMLFDAGCRSSSSPKSNSATATEGMTSPRVQQNFDFDWQFHLGDITNSSKPLLDAASWRAVSVPHDYSVEGGFSQTNFSCTGYLPGGVAWYQKSFVIPADWKDKLVSVQFDGVSEKSQVWLNDALVGGHPWAYTTFAVDLSGHINFGTTNVLTVRVDHSAMDDSRFYVGSGIYRHVWLIATEKTHIKADGVFVTTPEVSEKSARVEIETAIENQGGAGEGDLTTELFDSSGKNVGKVETKITLAGGLVTNQSVTLSSPKLWSPNSPALYTAVSTLAAGGKTVDVVKTTFGIRSLQFDAQLGFSLNGVPTKFKGVCLHHDDGALGAAVPEAALERRLRLLKDIGCNAIRTSHNAPDPTLLDLCDRMGFLVMDEAFDEWSGSKHKWLTGRNDGKPSLHGSYSEFFKQWAEVDMRDMVLRDRNHPSVVLWSIGNEVDYDRDPFTLQTASVLAADGKRLIKAVREADTTRPVTAGLATLNTSNPIGLADELDVVGYNYQLPQPLLGDLAKYPNRKFIGSEDGFEANYVDLIATNSRIMGQFLWVGFDFLGEAGTWPNHGSGSGLFDTSGVIKTAGELRASLWSEKPMVFVGVRPAPRGGGGRGRGGFGGMESHWNWAQDTRTNLPVQIYSNCKTVELFLNGKSLGERNMADAVNHTLNWDVAYLAGELKAVGHLDGKTAEYILRTAGEAARIDLVPDKQKLAADGEDAVNIELHLVDSKGVMVPNGNPMVTVQVSGPGRLRGLDNGNQTDNTALSSASRELNHGRALAVVQTLPTPGDIVVTVTAPGLPATHLTLRSR